MSHANHSTEAYDRHYFPQLWLLIAGFATFGLYVAWDRELLAMVYRFDQSRISLLISALVILASTHAIWHLLRYSREIALLSEWLDGGGATRPRLPDPLHSLVRDDDGSGDDVRQHALERHADRIRSPVELGWFLVDLAVRLGLVGTIIGFILIFTSLSDATIDGADGLRALLLTMSGGMGTALFTTLSGLIAGALLSFQYLILGRAAETLLGLATRLTAQTGRAA